MAQPRMSKPDAAQRRFVIVQSALAIVFALAMFGTRSALNGMEDVAARWLIAAVPIAILMVWAWAYVRFVRASDEMMRELQIRAIAISGALVILPATFWGMLERLMGVPEFPLFLIGPAFGIAFGVTWARVYASR